MGPGRWILLALLACPALGGDPGSSPGTSLRDVPVGNLTVVHHVDLLPDSGALWTLERRYPLESPLDERAWNATAAGLNETHPDFLRLVEGLRRSVEDGARAAGRPMEARNFTLQVRRETFGGQSHGVVAVRFEWRGLWELGGRFGDAFPEGIPLGPRDGLVLRYPSELSATYVYPAADQTRVGELVWLGPRNLGAGEPFVRLQREAPGLLLGSALGAAGAAAALAAVWRLRKSRRPTFEVDEGVVLKLVEETGELPQGAVIEKTGWSKARVSKVLTVLEKKGRVEKVRKGRENLVRARRKA